MDYTKKICARMRKLGLDSAKGVCPVVEEFREKGKEGLWISERSRDVIFGRLAVLIRVKEAPEYPVHKAISLMDENYIPYHIIITPTEVGRLMDIIYFSPDDLEENGTDSELAGMDAVYEGKRYFRLMSFCYNIDTEEYEYGSIGVINKAGGLYRIF